MVQLQVLNRIAHSHLEVCIVSPHSVQHIRKGNCQSLIVLFKFDLVEQILDHFRVEGNLITLLGPEHNQEVLGLNCI